MSTVNEWNRNSPCERQVSTGLNFLHASSAVEISYDLVSPLLDSKVQTNSLNDQVMIHTSRLIMTQLAMIQLVSHLVIPSNQDEVLQLDDPTKDDIMK